MEPLFLDERPDVHAPELFKPLLEEFAKNGRNQRRHGPYVLMGRIQIERNGNRKPALSYTPSLFKLPIGSMHSLASDLQRYLDRGFIVLDYWIPKPEEIVAERQIADHVKMSSGWRADIKTAEGQERLRNMENAILKAKGHDNAISSLKAKESALAQKLADALAENERLKEGAKPAATVERAPVSSTPKGR